MKTSTSIPIVIRQMAEILKERYRPEQIILFGSYASGKPRLDSDIDLLIVKKTKQPFFQRLTKVRRLVSNLRRGYAFDPIVVTPAELKRRLIRGDHFFIQVLAHGQSLYAHK